MHLQVRSVNIFKISELSHNTFTSISMMILSFQIKFFHFLYYSCPVLLQAAVEAISLAEKMGLADTPEGYTTMMNE